MLSTDAELKKVALQLHKCFGHPSNWKTAEFIEKKLIQNRIISSY